MVRAVWPIQTTTVEHLKCCLMNSPALTGEKAHSNRQSKLLIVLGNGWQLLHPSLTSRSQPCRTQQAVHILFTPQPLRYTPQPEADWVETGRQQTSFPKNGAP